MVLTLETGTEYLPDHERLRRSFVHDEALRRKSVVMQDRWDLKGRCTYYDIHLERNTIGTFRVSTGQNSAQPEERGIIQDWTKGYSSLPWGPHVLDVTRVSNDPEAQGKGLYGAQFLLALWAAERMPNITHVCAIIKSDLFYAQATLRRLGFIETNRGSLLHSYDVPGQVVPVVAMCHVLRGNENCREDAHLYSSAKLRSNGIDFPQFFARNRLALAG